MSDTVIKVENLGKMYIIGHQQESSYRYKALRDVLTDGAKSLVHKLRHPGKSLTPSNLEEFWALKDLSFEVKRGEVVGIIGHNGAGKSTLLKILSRVTQPSTGLVRMRGRVGSLLEVGTGFHPELTGRENIFLNGSILGMSRLEIKNKFDEIAQFAGIENFLDVPVKRYSSGMYVRLAFSVAAHLEPEILLLDEVLAVGDIKFQQQCLQKIQNIIKNQRSTILLVSHNTLLTKKIATRGLLIESGKIILDDSIHKVVENYIEKSTNRNSSIYNWVDDDSNGTTEVQFIKAYITQNSKLTTSFIHQSIDFTIFLEFKVNKSLHGLRIGFLMRDLNGVDVCGSNILPKKDAQFKPGFYKLGCRFPGGVLNSGEYLMRFGADLPPTKMILRSDFCLRISIKDDEGHVIFYERLPGIIKPKLVWEFEES